VVNQILYNRWAVSLFVFLTVFIYFWNIWINDIWIPNEAFYAESAREMLERGNFLDIYYNYEPRFNKPPMTYWIVALSYLIFGINEFAVRFPIVLSAIGTNILTFLIAKELYGKKVALFSAAAVAFSFQLVINSRYASPEIPLAFFFTLTLYLFLVGYKRRKWGFIFLSYIALGLTVLTKGFPYIIVIGGIVFLFLLIETRFSIKEFFREVLFLKLHIGIPVLFAVGLSWYVYMYLKFGQEFVDVTLQETIKRALGKKSQGFSSLFFYIPVILWGFLPYSLTFYYSFFHSLKSKIREFSFIFSWFIVMFVIFTIAKGKIPVYMIQGHIPMAIFVGYYLSNYAPSKAFEKVLYYGSLVVPVAVITALNVFLIFSFKLDYLYYIMAFFPIFYIIRYKDLLLAPFVSMLITFLIFAVSILPLVEKFRPYDKIGQVINDNVPEKDIPLIVEGYFWHNLPFYARRKVLRDYPIDKIVEYSKDKPVLALVTEKGLDKIDNSQILWTGRLYRRGSESRFAVFLKYIKKALNGDYSGFEIRYLIFKR
jgi:4-amino-4-deoxy-L-arabinose transferase-like glycosyltransferase